MDEPDFTQPWEGADKVLLVEGLRVYVNQAVLSTSSPVFEALFSDASNKTDMQEFPLPGKSLEAIIGLLQVLHHPQIDITREEILLLQPLFHEFKMDYWKDKCEQYWLSRNYGWYKLMRFGEKYEMKRLYDKCLLSIVIAYFLYTSYFDDDDEHFEMDDVDREQWCQTLSVKVDCYQRCAGSITDDEARSYLRAHWHHHPHPSLTDLEPECIQRGMILPLEGLLYLYDSGLIHRKALAAFLGNKVDFYERKYGWFGEEEAREGIARGLRRFPFLSANSINSQHPNDPHV